LVRTATAAACLGVLAGLWNVGEYFLACGRSSTQLCPAQRSAPAGLEGTLVLVLAILLILVSLASFVGPSVILYASGVLGLAIDVIVILNYSSIGPGSFYLTVALVTLSAALSLIAASRRTSVSEQSHPMNLPVFG
jgi:hypothetical protein